MGRGEGQLLEVRTDVLIGEPSRGGNVSNDSTSTRTVAVPSGTCIVSSLFGFLDTWESFRAASNATIVQLCLRGTFGLWRSR